MKKATRPASGLARHRAAMKRYYGKVLATKRDLEKTVCCTEDAGKRFPGVLALIPAEVKEKHYGCGCPIPEGDLAGLAVLDLGSGAGLDSFLVAHAVGPKGSVQGIDMTEEQLEVARRNVPAVTRAFGFAKPNVRFHHGYIEDAAMIPDRSIDLVISSCVINLSPAKDAVFRTIHRVLKDGGEFYVSDITADRRVPPAIAEDPKLVAECLGGAMYEHDWADVMKDAGFRDPRGVARRVIATEVAGEAITFYSATVRGFKFDEPLDRRCEDFGQRAVYRGTIPGCPARYALDDHHVFEKARPLPVCRNTARMLSGTRLAPHFEVSAPLRHFGIFRSAAAPTAPSAAGPGACC